MMKKILSLLAVGAVLVSASSVMAAGPQLFGQPVYFQDAPPAPAGTAPHAHPQPVAAGPVALFNCVKYKDLDEMAPCAVPLVVKVKDPCPTSCCNPCNCCAPKCVSIKICVPPCACCPPRIKCSRNGDRIRYDYGEYAIDIRVKKGYIEVDYQD